MRGHVKKRGGTWSYVVDVGTRLQQRCTGECGRQGIYWVEREPLNECPKCGSPLETNEARRQQWRSGFRLKGDAETALREVLRELGQGTYTTPTKVTLGDFMTEWLTERREVATTHADAKPRLSTVASYQMIADAYLLPALGQTKLVDLSPEALDALWVKLLTKGGRGGKPLAVKTVRNAVLLLHRVLTTAVRRRHITVNPVDACDQIPTGESHSVREKKMRERVWSVEELRTFLTHVEGDRWHPLALLLITTGLRRGEGLGLPWRCVDLEAGTIQVEQSLVLIDNEPTITAVKTPSSAARIALDGTTVDALKAHRRVQLAERLAWGPAYQDNDLVFSREDGSVLHPDRFLDWFKRSAKSAGLAPCRVHDLRHAHASMLLQAGVPMKMISERLRHAGIGITSDLYTHMSPEMDRQAADAGAAFIFGG